jgi:hypothetical protein
MGFGRTLGKIRSRAQRLSNDFSCDAERATRFARRNNPCRGNSIDKKQERVIRFG